ncbi:MAG: serine hydrolase domain-containing protein, partial [Pyrinomonadaceae bacterium]
MHPTSAKRLILALTIAAAPAYLLFCRVRAQADEVDLVVRAQLKSQGIPGVAVAILKDGKIVKLGGYGLADMQSGEQVRADTPFQIQSITKQFTATGIMMLVEEGKTQLDQPISKYLEGAPKAWEKITIAHLLGQTSGLKDFINDPTPVAHLAKTDEDVLRQASDRPLDFQPGDAWAYSNTNYHLLAMIIQSITGKWYGDFLDERIFKPLGMEQTAVMKPADSVPRRALGYVRVNGKLQPGTVVGVPILGYGGGGIRSTVLDLAKWDEALYGEKLLKQSSLAQMWTPVKLNNGTSHNYGFGW